MPALTVREIAELCGGRFEGDADRLISGANSLSDARPDEVSFAENRRAAEAAESSKAGCLLTTEDFDATGEWSVIRVSNPRFVFMRVLAALYPPKHQTATTDATAVVAPSAKVAPDSSIGAYVTIGERAEIGSRCIIHAGCRIGEDVSIGNDTILYPNVTLYEKVRLGSRVILHAGCVIGADGFGFVFARDHYEKFPQVGSVEIEDDVEIGANSCVDRAALGVTRVQHGTKLDNLVHVGHNCAIGKHVVVAAQTGFSGSARVGDYVVIGGQVGVGDKATIEAKAIVGGQSGVLTGRPVKAGEPVWGTPARPIKQHLRGLAHVDKLESTLREIREIKKRLSDLESAAERSAKG